MANPSNLYAEKVFAEHPIALWSLDDDAGFASFISDANKDLTTWTKTGAGATVASFNNANFPYPPLENDYTAQVSISGGSSTVTLTSTATFTSKEAETFSIGFYLYDNSQVITKIEVGYGANLFEVDLPKEATFITDRQWLHVSKQITARVAAASSIVIKVTYNAPTGTQTFIINGVSIGNHSEEFNGSTTGQYPSTFPATVARTTYAWSGTAQSSTSIATYLDGTTRTNLVKNPIPSTSTPVSPQEIWGLINRGTGGAGTTTLTAAGALDTVTTAASTTAYSFGITGSTNAQRIQVTAGQIYAISFYVKSSINDVRRLAATFYNSAGTSLGEFPIATFTLTAGVEKRLSGTVTAPANAVSMRIYAGATTGSVIRTLNSTMTWHSALVEATSTIGTYFDGSTNHTVISADSYGYADYDGYYVVKNGKILASNSGMPMVYGAQNATSCFYQDDEGDPSLILPGAGFLHANGSGNKLSLEAWLRISTTATDEKRILGPIGSTDGLYVKGPFLMLRIDSYYGLHYVGEWNRPMLVNINVFNEGASLLLNGEIVISLSFDKDSLVFETDATKDFIGFYAHSDVTRIDVDCVGIYPYVVPQEVAKRRYIYGQGVQFPEELNKAYNGESFITDYSFANYSNNSVYPDTFKWNEALVENLAVVNKTLALPQYTKPEIFYDVSSNATITAVTPSTPSSTYVEYTAENDFAVGDTVTISGLSPDAYNGTFVITHASSTSFSVSNSTTTTVLVSSGTANLSILESLYIDNVAATTRPKNFFQFSRHNGHFLFETLNKISSNVASLYGVFRRTASTTTEQILIKVVDELSGDYLKAALLSSQVVYTFYSSGATVWTSTMAPTISVGEDFVCGFSFKQMILNNNVDGLARFLSNANNLRVFVGGGDTTSSSGKISYTHTFDGYIYSVGFSSQRNYDKIDTYFDTDSGVIENVDTGATVTALLDHYASYTLIAKIIAEQLVVDIAVDGYWQDYIPLSTLSKYITNESAELEYDIDYIQFNIDYPKSTDPSSEMLRSYLSFQTMSSGANSVPATKVAVSSNNAVIADSVDWATEMYEVVTGDVIYPPSGVDTQTLALDIHLEFQVDGIFSNPLFIREMQLASKALNAAENPIDSKFGTSLYPYTIDGASFDYRAQNPVTIYKGKSPYLYLSDDSGVRLSGATLDGTRGIYVKLNKTKDSYYKISSMNMIMKYPGAAFPSTETEIFNITDKIIGTISFYVIATNTSGTRGKIYMEKSASAYYGATIFVNGKPTAQSEINIDQWNSIGVSFTSILDFNSADDKKIKIVDKILINSISFFQVSQEESSQSVTVRTWNEVSADIWDDWYTATPNLWYNVLLTEGPPQIYGINPQDIFEIYSGTHKIIPDSNNTAQIEFSADGYRAYLNYRPLTYTITPA